MMNKSWISYPYIVWMAIFIVVPLLLVLFFTFTASTENGLVFTFEHIARVWDPVYIMVLARSVWLALLSTAVCFLVGYPAALILASRDFCRKKVLVSLFVIPMWINFLLRTYAWMTILENNGLINSVLALLHLPQLKLLYSTQAVVLGMVYNFLPFMVLPIYSVLSKMDRSVLEAAEDLGANYLTVFRRVVFPLSMPGVVSGVTMVFMPAVTTFVISKLLGGGQYTLIGNLIEQQYLYVGDWNFGSALSFILMVLILISMGVMFKYDKDREGGMLW